MTARKLTSGVAGRMAAKPAEADGIEGLQRHLPVVTLEQAGDLALQPPGLRRLGFEFDQQRRTAAD